MFGTGRSPSTNGTTWLEQADDRSTACQQAVSTIGRWLGYMSGSLNAVNQHFPWGSHVPTTSNSQLPTMARNERAQLLALGTAAATGVAAACLVADQIRKRAPKFKQQYDLLKQYEAAMLPPTSAMETLELDITKQMKAAAEKPNGSTVLMLPTYICQLPTGDETGSCYALDIGGTNFRTVYYKLSAEHGKVESTVMKQVAIPESVYTGTCNQLFDFMAKALVDFIEEQEAAQGAAKPAPTAAAGSQPSSPRRSGKPAPVVGFCFSFAVEQTALDNGKLMGWTKGFDVDGVIGKDVVKLLSDALVRAGRQCRVLALINDSVGVLTAARYFDQSTGMGLIMGTGTNACIVEKVSDVPKWRPKGVSGDTLTAINTEWGCYGSGLLPRVQEDLDLDEASGAQKGKMLIEKLMSGLYMGENTRRILATFATKSALLGPTPPPKVLQPGSFTTEHLCYLESDTSLTRSEVARVLREALGVDTAQLGLETLLMVQWVCRLVVRRSARTAATLLLGTLRHQGWLDAPQRLVVAVDGGVWLKYANWQRYLQYHLRELLGSRASKMMPLLQFKPQADGSSFGAAVIAAAAAAAQDGTGTHSPVRTPGPARQV